MTGLAPGGGIGIGCAPMVGGCCGGSADGACCAGGSGCADDDGISGWRPARQPGGAFEFSAKRRAASAAFSASASATTASASGGVSTLAGERPSQWRTHTARSDSSQFLVHSRVSKSGVVRRLSHSFRRSERW